MARFLLLLTTFLNVNLLAMHVDKSPPQHCSLTQQEISLGHFDATDTFVAKLSPDGAWFGQIDIYADGYLWSMTMPEMPILEVARVDDEKQYFTNVSFSDDSKYVIFDSELAQPALPTRGRIIVFSLERNTKQYFDTYSYGGTTRSKFAISSSNLLAYVPHDNHHEIRIVNLVSGATRSLVEDSGCGIGALAFSPNNSDIAIKDLCGAFVTIRSLATNQLLKSLPLDEPMPDDDGSPDQSIFYWGDGTMLAVNSDLNEAATGMNAETGHGQFPFMWAEPLAMFHSNNSQMLAIADFTGVVNVQKRGDEDLYICDPFGFGIFTFAGAFSPSDDAYVAGSSNGAVAVVMTNNLETPLCGDMLTTPYSVQQIVFTANDAFISLTARFALSLWKINYSSSATFVDVN